MYYTIKHKTRFRYTSPINQSVMEARMQPRSDRAQRCLRFQLATTPRSQVSAHRDHLGNVVHHFDIPGSHTQLTLNAEAFVEIMPTEPVPQSLGLGSWAQLDAATASDDYWDWLMPSTFAQPTRLLEQLARELNLGRRTDPLTTMRTLNHSLFDMLSYTPQSTKVDSPIDDALRERRGVCQDYAHIMIALVREMGIPCRYVSGYLFHHADARDRSAQDATHAWVEAWLPGLEWVGFDPTNNLITGDRHIRVAVGRDYADVPPTRGVYRGGAEGDLSVSVQVAPAEAPAEEESLPAPVWEPLEGDQDQQQQ